MNGRGVSRGELEVKMIGFLVVKIVRCLMICAASAKAELRDLDHFDERLESLLVTTPAPSTSKKHK